MLRSADSGPPQSSPGRLILFTGCMFSGKTERLIAALRDAERAGLPVAAFKHDADRRYSACDLISHSHQRHDAVSVADASRILARVGPANIVAVDEGQFFGTDLLDVCAELRRRGCRVLVAGLDHDCWGHPFRPMPELADIADETIHTTAICAVCRRPATRTYRRIPVQAGQSLIGGPEAYEPRCTRCFRPPTVLDADQAAANV